MTTNKPEVFEVYRTKQGTLENVVLLADYEALQAEREKLRKALELARPCVQRDMEAAVRENFGVVGNAPWANAAVDARDAIHTAIQEDNSCQS